MTSHRIDTARDAVRSAHSWLMTRTGMAVVFGAFLVLLPVLMAVHGFHPALGVATASAAVGLGLIAAEAVLRRFGYRIGRQSSR